MMPDAYYIYIFFQITGLMGVLEPDAVQFHTAGPLQLGYLKFVQLFVPIPLLVFGTLAKGVVQHRLLKMTLA